jgi:hypothetical protein
MAGVAFMYVGTEAIFALVALVPLSYATLIFCILPALWLLRRYGNETQLSFSLACGLATFIPWFAVYVFLFPAGTSKYAGAYVEVLIALGLAALFAAIAGVVVHRCGRVGAGNQPA